MHNYKALRPFFLNVPLETVKHTIDITTQIGHNVLAGPNMYKTFRSPFPAMNVLRCNEAVATDTNHSDVPAMDSGGIIHAQIFVGRESLIINIYGMKNENQFVNSLLEVIRKQGAMNKLISDSARVEISKRIIDVLRYYNIDSWQSEPYFQHQNFAERQWQDVKRLTLHVLHTSGAPEYTWLFALKCSNTLPTS
jgi:hypothetical protein